MIPFSVDAVYTDSEISQFASQLPLIPEEYKEIVRKKFGGAHSPDYYAGLLVGYANALVMIRDLPKDLAQQFATVLVASVAHHIENSP